MRSLPCAPSSHRSRSSSTNVIQYMNSLGFKQNHTLTDVRLVIGFTACAIAGATFYYDFTLGFEKTKEYTLYAVVAYFVLNTALTWWIWMVEGGKVYIGERNGVKVRVLLWSLKIVG